MFGAILHTVTIEKRSLCPATSTAKPPSLSSIFWNTHAEIISVWLSFTPSPTDSLYLAAPISIRSCCAHLLFPSSYFRL